LNKECPIDDADVSTFEEKVAFLIEKYNNTAKRKVTIGSNFRNKRRTWQEMNSYNINKNDNNDNNDVIGYNNAAFENKIKIVKEYLYAQNELKKSFVLNLINYDKIK
jgi:hypothetical protein